VIDIYLELEWQSCIWRCSHVYMW